MEIFCLLVSLNSCLPFSAQGRKFSPELSWVSNLRFTVVMWHVFFAQLFIREQSSKDIRIYNSNSLRGRQNRASFNEWEQWKKIPVNNAQTFKLLFLSLLLGCYQDFILCCCRIWRSLLPSLHLIVTSSVKNSSHCFS